MKPMSVSRRMASEPAAPGRHLPQPSPTAAISIAVISSNAMWQQNITARLADAHRVHGSTGALIAAARGQGDTASSPLIILAEPASDRIRKYFLLLHNIIDNAAFLFLSEAYDQGLMEYALSPAVLGYHVGPFEETQLALLIDKALQHKALTLRCEDSERRYAGEVSRRTSELMVALDQLETASAAHAALQEDMLSALATATGVRDRDTGEHLWRVSGYTRLLGELAGREAAECEWMSLAGTLHDVGNVGISDDILGKPAPLSADEFEQIQQHTLNGSRILSEASSPLMQTAAEMTLTHHEWWDGTGYPHGLVGAKIPLAGRIVAIGDVFDALTTPRSGRAALAAEVARERLAQLSGTQFDPELMALFLAAWDEVLAIHAGHIAV